MFKFSISFPEVESCGCCIHCRLINDNFDTKTEYFVLLCYGHLYRNEALDYVTLCKREKRAGSLVFNF